MSCFMIRLTGQSVKIVRTMGVEKAHETWQGVRVTHNNKAHGLALFDSGNVH